MIIENEFGGLSEEQAAKLNSYFTAYDYDASGYTFIACYIWRDTYGMRWGMVDDVLCVASVYDGEDEKNVYASYPMKPDGPCEGEELKRIIGILKKDAEDAGFRFVLSGIPGKLMENITSQFGDEIEIIHTGDEDEYVYLREKLVSLTGRKLHKKKNHLNYFLKNTEFTYEEITEANLPEVLHYCDSKNEFKLGETPDDWKEVLEDETIAIHEMVKFVGKGVIGGAIRINGKICAVTMGEFQNPDDRRKMILHVEKADDRIRGLYQAINNEFAKRLPEETVYINREEDMGLESLRQAKEGYCPEYMAERYGVKFKA